MPALSEILRIFDLCAESPSSEAYYESPITRQASQNLKLEQNQLPQFPLDEMRPILAPRKVVGRCVPWELGRFPTLLEPTRAVLATGLIRDLRG